MLADIFTDEERIIDYQKHQNQGVPYQDPPPPNAASQKEIMQKKYCDEILSFLYEYPTHYCADIPVSRKHATSSNESAKSTSISNEDQYHLNDKIFFQEYKAIYQKYTGSTKQEFSEQLVLFDSPTIGPIHIPQIDVLSIYNHSYDYSRFHDVYWQQDFLSNNYESQFRSKYEFLSALFAKCEEALLQKENKKKFELKYLSKEFGPEKIKQKITHENHIFTCLQHAKKFHPDFDQVLINLMLADPHAILILLESYQKMVLHRWPSYLKAHFKPILKRNNIGIENEALERIVDEYVQTTIRSLCERIIFIQRVSREDLLLILSTSDVMLDTFPWGAGLTSLEAFTFGIPVIVYPEGTNVLQLAFGQYRRMELFTNHGTSKASFLSDRDTDEKSPSAVKMIKGEIKEVRSEEEPLNLFIASSIEDYVEKSIALVKNKILLEEVKHEILKNVYKLFEYEDVVNEWNEFIFSACM